MDELDYVETSDPEELEISHQMLDLPLARATRLIAQATSPDLIISRKRRKVFHFVAREENDTLCEPTSSSYIDNKSMAPGPSSPYPPTSTAVSDDELLNPAGILSFKRSGTSESGGAGLGGLSPHIEVLDDVFGTVRGSHSQDELDVISQPITQTSTVPRGQLSYLNVSDGLRGKILPENAMDNNGVQGQDSCGLFPSLTSLRKTISAQTALNRDELSADSPGRRSALRPTFSSLPPSSPSHASSSVINSPNRSAPRSPDLGGRSDTVGSNVLLGDSEIPLHSSIEALDETAPRRYSLRARQARQLNPYEYDKRLYKQQMKRLPDAMVKVVSPQRHGPGRAHRHREAEEDEDFVVPDDGGESREARRGRTEPRRSSEPPNEQRARDFSWLPQVFHMSDEDDLTPLSPLANRDSVRVSASENLKQKHGTRHKPFKFPLKEVRIRGADSPERRLDLEISDPSRSAITYKRRKDIWPSPRRVAERSDSNLSRGRIEFDRNALPSPEASVSAFRETAPATGGAGHDTPDDDDQRDFDVDDHNVYETAYDDDSDGAAHASDSRGGVDSDELSHSPHSESPSDLDDELSRRRMRVLERLYPRSMINKGYFNKRPVLTRDRSRSAVKPTTVTEEGSGSGNNISLSPGRSRITKRSNPSRADWEIRGDTESSDSDSGMNGAEETRPDIVDGDSSDSEASVASFPNSDDGDILDTSIADTGYFDLDYSRQSGCRREEPLFDRMLSRAPKKRSSSKVKSKRSKARASTARLAANGLDVNFSGSSSQPGPRGDRTKERQTRLRFEPAAIVDRSGDERVIDLTNLELEPEGIQGVDDEASPANNRKALRRLTKKRRREAVEKAALHTFNSEGKKIRSGRRKGYITVQIDLADAGFRNAIKPLHRDAPLQSQPAFSRTGPKKAPRCFERLDDKENLKQTSLDDFAFDNVPVFDSAEFAEPTYRPASTSRGVEWQNEDRVRFCSVDMGISMPIPGLAFGATTYLGRQLLPDLLNFAFKNAAPSWPGSYSGFGMIDLDAEMSANSFAEAVDVTCNVLYEWLDEKSDESIDEDSVCRYEQLMLSISRFASWMYGKVDAEGKRIVQATTTSCVERLRQKLQETAKGTIAKATANDRCLSVLWFVVELATRALTAMQGAGTSADSTMWIAVVSLLAETLVEFGIERTLTAIEKRDMSSMTTELRTAELWVCMIHLLSHASGYFGTSSDVSGIFWTIIMQVVKGNRVRPMSNIVVSEHLWRLILGLSALSHFSSRGIATSEPRLPACWDIVGLALDTIRLTHDKEEDSKVALDSLKRRDKYLRMVVARCFTLSARYKWPSRDANVVFKKLVDIFRSRNFGNLLGEGSEFPGFLRYQNITLLDELHHSDTAFSVYLKLVIQAARADPEGPRNDARVAKARLMKLLSLVVPLSGVPVSRDKAMTTEELSMLVNRFSAIAIAILVDGKENANVQQRVDQARRFISFVDADFKSRQICVQASMYMTIVACHLSLEPEAPLQWLGEMCQTLLEEFQKSNQGSMKETNAPRLDGVRLLRHELILLLHLVLRCVTNIIEKPGLQADGSASRYPDVALISGPWVKRVFSTKELTNVVSTRSQVLLLVQSFLNARGKIFPPPRRQASSAAAEIDPESQDFFAEFTLDDEVLASVPLGDGFEDNWAKDKETAKIMNSDIIPHIFRLLLQYFNDPTARPSDESKLEGYWGRADDWIDCWVGCAAVVARNGIRGWDHYLNVGPQSWAGIGDSFFRRRVAVRFMYQLLKCDPTAYSKAHERHFLSVLLQGLVAHRITMENEYLSILFSIDGLRHPLLRELPAERAAEQEEFRLSRSDFLEKREPIIAGIFNNLNTILLSDSSERDKNVLIECILEMLSTMQDIHANFTSIEDRDKYTKLCRHVFSEIQKHPRVDSLQRLSTLVTWGRSFIGPD